VSKNAPFVRLWIDKATAEKTVYRTSAYSLSIRCVGSGTGIADLATMSLRGKFVLMLLLTLAFPCLAETYDTQVVFLFQNETGDWYMNAKIKFEGPKKATLTAVFSKQTTEIIKRRASPESEKHDPARARVYQALVQRMRNSVDESKEIVMNLSSDSVESLYRVLKMENPIIPVKHGEDTAYYRATHHEGVIQSWMNLDLNDAFGFELPMHHQGYRVSHGGGGEPMDERKFVYANPTEVLDGELKQSYRLFDFGLGRAVPVVEIGKSIGNKSIVVLGSDFRDLQDGVRSGVQYFEVNSEALGWARDKAHYEELIQSKTEKLDGKLPLWEGGTVTVKRQGIAREADVLSTLRKRVRIDRNIQFLDNFTQGRNVDRFAGKDGVSEFSCNSSLQSLVPSRN